MSGLDKIVGTIQQEAESKAADIMAKARDKVLEIQRVTDEQKQIMIADQDETAKRNEAIVGDRFASENRQQRKKALLYARSEVISDVIQSAKERIISLPDDEYFTMMKNICVRNANKGVGKLFFAKNDYGRMPDWFIGQCNQEIIDGSVELGGSVDFIEHGFMITYGKVEQNCSLESIFEINKNAIWDVVNVCLNEQA